MEFGAPQVGGITVAAIGASLVAWCVIIFAFIGRGTPIPFDPPRRLVMRGPYRFVRNPMAIGAGATLGGAALFYQSLPLLGLTGIFVVVIHLLVVLHEEPVIEGDIRRRVRRLLRLRATLVATPADQSAVASTEQSSRVDEAGFA